jgi:hypothetical protein
MKFFIFGVVTRLPVFVLLSVGLIKIALFMSRTTAPPSRILYSLKVAVETRIAPPAQIPASAANAPAPPSGQTSETGDLDRPAIRRTATNRIEVATRLSVRAAAA